GADPRPERDVQDLPRLGAEGGVDRMVGEARHPDRMPGWRQDEDEAGEQGAGNPSPASEAVEERVGAGGAEDRGTEPGEDAELLRVPDHREERHPAVEGLVEGEAANGRTQAQDEARGERR